MITTLIIIGCVVVAYAITFYLFTKPNEERGRKLQAEEALLKRELTMQELIDKGYTSEFKVSLIFFHYLYLYPIWRFAVFYQRIFYWIFFVILMFLFGFYIGSK